MFLRTLRFLALIGIVSLGLGPLGQATLANWNATGLVLSVTAAEAAEAHGEALEMTIDVNYKGFDSKKDLVINAAQGQEVRLTFVWADKAVPDNSHRILVKGYNVRSGLLTPEAPQDTITFIADKAGSFEVICDWRCEGHDDIRATLRVGGGEAVAATTPSLISLTSEAGDNGIVSLTAWLHESGGSPIENATIRFAVEKELAGFSGFADIGSATTDKDGKASITYRPAQPGLAKGKAQFAGIGRYAESAAEFEVSSESAHGFEFEPIGLDAVRQWAPIVLLLVVAGVWLTIGYVVFNIYGVYRARPRSALVVDAGEEARMERIRQLMT
jgi:hypothetical protein